MIALPSFLPEQEACSDRRYNELVFIAIVVGGRQKARCSAFTVRL